MQITLKNYYSNDLEQIPVCALKKGSLPFDSSRFNGFFARLAGRCVGLVSLEELLFVLVDMRLIEVNEQLSIEFERIARHRKLTIKDEHAVHVIYYENDECPVSTPYYSEDDEDADFGLWLYNILSSPQRKMILIQSWARG